MDDPVSAFYAADLIWMDIITAHYSDDRPLGGYSQDITAPRGLCIPKMPGSYDLVLTPKEFGYPQISTPLRFRGTPIGADPADASVARMRWAVDEIVNVYVPGENVRIESVKGQLTGKIWVVADREIDSAPSVSPSGHPFRPCGTDQHHFKIELTIASSFVGTNEPKNELVLAMTYNPDGSDGLPSPSLTGRICKVAMLGIAAINLSGLSVSIKVKKRWKCWAGPVAGTSQMYWAVADGPLKDSAKFQWEVDGAEFSASNDILTVSIPNPPHPFSITVTATVFGVVGAVKRRLTVTPLTYEEAAFAEEICSFIGRIKQAEFRGPLVRQPHPAAILGVSPDELLGIRAAADRISAAATRLLEVGPQGTRRANPARSQ